MAEKRKLQQDIEKTLKRVEEGIEEFDGVFVKFHECSHSTQRDKLEGELKKEIKKLQRLRDQIKNWQSSSDVKDKKPLDAARRKIEKEMERFKVCERELKIKAFSKEGLAQQAKRDPHEAERDKHKRWLREFIDSISDRLDSYEVELEIFKNNRKGKLKPTEAERVAKLELWIFRHNWHLSKLEMLLRRLENDSLALSLLEDTKDLVECYLSESEGKDFVFDDSIYEEFGLEEDESLLSRDSDIGLGERSHSLTDSASLPSVGAIRDPTPPAMKSQTPSSRPAGTISKSLEHIDMTATTPASNVEGVGSGEPSKYSEQIKPGGSGWTATRFNELIKTIEGPPASSPPNASSDGGREAEERQKGSASVSKGNIQSTDMSHLQTPDQLHSNIKASLVNSRPPSHPTPTESINRLLPSLPAMTPVKAPGPPSQLNGSTSPTLPPSVEFTPQGISVEASERVEPTSLTEVKGSKLPPPSDPTTINKSWTPGLQTTTTPKGSNTVAVDNLNSVSSISEVSSKIGEDESHKTKASHSKRDLSRLIAVVEAAHQNLPHMGDRRHFRYYQPKSVWSDPPPSFPLRPLHNFGSKDFFSMLGLDTLFFSFYHQQGTYQQLLASRELKNQSWCYHKKYLTWFRPQGSGPQTVTQSHYQGSFVYFDSESGWCSRVKDDFVFELIYLEDETSPPFGNSQHVGGGGSQTKPATTNS